MILDCTVRDGGYANNFQFSLMEIKKITKTLNDASIDLIEVGHGLGLGAGNAGHGYCFEDEYEQIKVAKSASKKSLIGTFFVCGIGRIENIKKAKKFGADFIRIGFEIHQLNELKKIINYCKKIDIKICLNLMKTHTVGASDLKKATQFLSKFHIEYFYIVDSSGSMTTFDLGKVIEIVKSNCKHKIGLHCHNNLGLANSNSLWFMKSGGNIIDGTLGSMGRSAGNAQTEIISYLYNKELGKKYNIQKLIDLSDKIISPLMIKKQGIEKIDMLLGMSGIHSSLLKLFRKAINVHNTSLEDLILETAKINNRNPSLELINSVAKEISRFQNSKIR
jgi:4-hydroxy 2-oxovalerate aldolase